MQPKYVAATVLYYTRYLFAFGATAPIEPGPPHSRGFYITHNDVTQ